MLHGHTEEIEIVHECLTSAGMGVGKQCHRPGVDVFLPWDYFGSGTPCEDRRELGGGLGPLEGGSRVVL